VVKRRKDPRQEMLAVRSQEAQAEAQVGTFWK